MGWFSDGLLGAVGGFANSMAQSTRENALLQMKEEVERARMEAVEALARQRIEWQDERAEEKRIEQRDLINERASGYANDRFGSAIEKQREGLQQVLDAEDSYFGPKATAEDIAAAKESARQGLISMEEAKEGGYEGNTSDDVTSRDRLRAYAEEGIKPGEADLKMIDVERQDAKDLRDERKLDQAEVKAERAARAQEISNQLKERGLELREKQIDAQIQRLERQGGGNGGSTATFIQEMEYLKRMFPKDSPTELLDRQAKLHASKQPDWEERTTPDPISGDPVTTTIRRGHGGAPPSKPGGGGGKPWERKW